MKSSLYSGNPQPNVSRIETLIADLKRVVRLLNCEIELHKETARVKDPANFAYPIAARTMTARRDNLQLTIATLEQR
jgi:hypothetical protein